MRWDWGGGFWKETRRGQNPPQWGVVDSPSKHMNVHLQEITKSNWVSGQTCWPEDCCCCCCCCCICCICICCCCWILWLATAFFKFSMNCFWSLGINPMYCKPAGAFFIRRRIIIWGGFSAEFSFLKCCKKCDTHVVYAYQINRILQLICKYLPRPLWPGFAEMLWSVFEGFDPAPIGTKRSLPFWKSAAQFVW